MNYLKCLIKLLLTLKQSNYGDSFLDANNKVILRQILLRKFTEV
jgi:hypothetical protein